MPTDFSKNSWNAIQYAVKLYDDQDCDFYILNTYTEDAHGLGPYVLLDPDDGLNKLSEQHSRKGLGEVMTSLTFEHDNPNHRLHLLSCPALFIDTVKKIVSDMPLDLIIMGAKVQVLSLGEKGALNPQKKDNKARLREYLKDVDHEFNVLHNVKITAALSCFVKIRNSQMISYIDKKPSFWERLGFGKPTLGRLGYFKDVPVLGLHG